MSQIRSHRVAAAIAPVFGSIVADMLGSSRVVIDRAIARGDKECRVVVHLKPTPESDTGGGRGSFTG